MFTPAILAAARAIEPSGRGELEITDAIQHLIDDGRKVESHTVSGWWKDTGQLADMLEANRLVLEEIERSVDGELVEARLEGRGRDRAGREARALGRSRPGGDRRRREDRRLLHRPLHLDRRGVARSLGSEVEHSILLAGARVVDLETRIEASLLGRNVSVLRGDGDAARPCG